ncbi:hypothetical protein CP969_30385 [Streptomyces viridosporus T7A]|uniref:Zf-HC2 domain-containing protein n=1 Tax=Streptomyces viridosporus T7A TaxID=665577 RepID=A0ABX6ANH3_STRVD|nr:hypothetical protein CP969_30385 [Streptomyces viridosporus T7A]
MRAAGTRHEQREGTVTHVETAHLVELALGHIAHDDLGALRHIAECARCRDELRTMTRVVAAARTADIVDLPTAPPEHVWQRIARELSQGAGAPPPSARDAAHRPPAGPAGRAAPGRTVGAGGEARRLLLGLLGLLGLLAGVAVARRAGRGRPVRAACGPVRRPGRRRRSPWWPRAY